MDRRELFKFLGLGALAGALPASKAIAKHTELIPPMPSPDWKLDEAFSVTNYFDAIPFKPGEHTEFPLDLLTGENNVAIIYSEYDAPVKTLDADAILVPTFDIAFDKAKTYGDAVDGLIKKMNLQAAGLLYNAAYNNYVLIGANNRKRLDAIMRTHLRRVKGSRISSVRYKSFTYGPYVIGVDLNSDAFVMPIRQGPEVFQDVDKTFYSFTELGMACLNLKSVVIGKIE